MQISSLAAIIWAVTAFVQADFAGEFSLACSPLTLQRSDPLISPGIASGHVHGIVGGNSFSRNMAAPNAATVSTATSCNVDIDHSNYWVPVLYHIRSDGLYELVQFTGNNVYYFNRACDYTATPTTCDNIHNNVSPKAFPPGFRMIAGDSTRRTYNASDFTNQAVAIMCANNPGIPDKEGPSMPTTKCQTFRAEVYFPSCWDGVNLDSANHKDHVSYPDYAHGSYMGGYCPQSHPVGLFSLFYEFFFTTNVYADINNFIFANGDTTGYGFHGDFINGWTDQNVLQNAFNCIGQACPINAAVGNGGHRIGTSTPNLITPAIYEEQIGLNGPIASLPGQVPHTGSTSMTPTTMMTSTTTGPPATTTPSNGWRSLGCYSDSTATRTLGNGVMVAGGPGAMTVEACQTACHAAGYSLAGVEYSQECYCDNAFQHGGGPAPDGNAQCNMACAGNRAEMCGGPNRLDVYQLVTGSGASSTVVAMPTGSSKMWSLLGCYTDSVNMRTLKWGQNVPNGAGALTVEVCQSLCKNAGYSLAGVEYGDECYCDNMLENGGGPAPDGNVGCKMACSGNSMEMCGGSNRLNLYQFA